MRWVTFDCFGTLIDWRHGIATSADLIAPGRGAELLDLYTKHEPQVQTESPTLRYRHVLAESLRRACTEAGVPLLDDDASIPHLDQPPQLPQRPLPRHRRPPQPHRPTPHHQPHQWCVRGCRLP